MRTLLNIIGVVIIIVGVLLLVSGLASAPTDWRMIGYGVFAVIIGALGFKMDRQTQEMKRDREQLEQHLDQYLSGATEYSPPQASVRHGDSYAATGSDAAQSPTITHASTMLFTATSSYNNGIKAIDGGALMSASERLWHTGRYLISERAFEADIDWDAEDRYADLLPVVQELVDATNDRGLWILYDAANSLRVNRYQQSLSAIDIRARADILRSFIERLEERVPKEQRLNDLE